MILNTKSVALGMARKVKQFIKRSLPVKYFPSLSNSSQAIAISPQLRMIYTFPPGDEIIPPSVPSGYRLLHYQTKYNDAWLRLLNHSGEFTKFSPNTFRKEILSGLIPEGGVFVENQGKLVASAAVCKRPEAIPNVVLMYVIVLPEHRGLGLGKIVTTQVMAVACQAGYPGIVLATDERRLPAIRMYLGLGFQPELGSHLGAQVQWEQVFQQIRS